MSHLTALEPLDAHNRQLQSQVHPSDWINPKPDGRYNLVVIGAGTAGLVTAAGAAGLGAKVALVERGLMGGDCLNVGCVPSKALLAIARAVAAVRYAQDSGIQVQGYAVDFSQIMQRMRRLRAEISPNDSAKRFSNLGVDVYLGEAKFADSNHVEVAGQKLPFRKAVIATGARASAPPIQGLDQIDYLTNENLFSLTELPARLGVVGAGPIGCEMAQAFARFGSQVSLVESSEGILPREDRTAAAVVQNSLRRDGVQLLCNGKQLELCRADGAIRLTGQTDQGVYDVLVDKLLVAAGRAPNVKGLNLDAIGVEYDSRQGITVDDRLRTSNPNVFAAGDVCSKFQFTHAADFMARTVLQNALFMGRKKVSSMIIPWCTYTDPELAHVGLTERDANQQDVAIETFEQEFSEVDRAILTGQTEGFVKIHVLQGTDRIVGATIVGPSAGDLIGEVSLAMTNGIGLGKIASTIHPYPTTAEAIRKVGDAYNRTRLTPFVKKLFEKWLAWTR